jgi:hypothetical protein
VSADGHIDPRWLLLDGTPASRVLSIVATPSGAVVLGLLTGGSQGAMLEVHLWAPSRGPELTLPERIGRQALPKGWTPFPVLQQHDKGWFWVDPEAPQKLTLRVAGTEGDDDGGWQRKAGPLTTIPQAASQPALEPGGALYNPWAATSGAARVDASKASQEPPPAPSATLPQWLLAGALAFALAALLRRALRFN